MTDERSLPDDLPCPAPLPGVVEAGVFGVAEDGHPDQEEIRSLTEEHAHEMVAVLVDLAYLEWCRDYGLDPSTGKSPRPNVGENLGQRLHREIDEYSDRYEACIAAYADAFGLEASETLDASVRRFVAANFSKEAPAVQRRLF